MTIPSELRYTEEHEWVAEGESERLRIGITDYAQRQLGDVVFVELPDLGSQLEAGAVFGEVESTKSVSELFAPLAGEVVAVNEAVVDSPELINEDPYGDGWLIELNPSKEQAGEAVGAGGQVDRLLDSTAYQELIRESD